MNLVVTGNLSEFYFRVRGIPQALRDKVSLAVRESIDDVRDYIKYVLLAGKVLNKRTGKLAESIKSTMKDDLTGAVYSDGSARYWAANEFGVQHPWVITASHKVMHFVMEGRDVFTPIVLRSGLPERSYLRRGLQDKIPDIRANITKRIQEAMGG